MRMKKGNWFKESIKEHKLFAIFSVIMLFLLVSMIYALATIENITIEGKVIDVIALDDYFVITLDTNETYNISYPSRISRGTVLDLTVNSKFIFKLSYYDIWFLPNTDNRWNIERILKVPENPGGMKYI